MIKLFTLSDDKENVIIHLHNNVDKKEKNIICENMHKAILYKIKR